MNRPPRYAFPLFPTMRFNFARFCADDGNASGQVRVLLLNNLRAMSDCDHSDCAGKPVGRYAGPSLGLRV